MSKLTIGMIQGSNYTKEITVPFQGEKVEVEIRPLTGPEATKVEEVMQDGTTMKGVPGRGGKMEQQMSMDMRKNIRGRKESDMLAVVHGTVDEAFTKEMVEKYFSNDLIKEIAKEVKEISGIGNQKQVEDFRTDYGQRNEKDESELLHSGEGSGDSAE